MKNIIILFCLLITNVLVAQWGENSTSVFTSKTKLVVGSTSLQGNYGANDGVLQIISPSSNYSFLTLKSGSKSLSIGSGPYGNAFYLPSNESFNFSYGADNVMNINPNGSIGIGGNPFGGIKTYIFQGETTAPSYGSAALFAFNSISHTSGEQSKIRGIWSLSLNNKSGVLNESIGIDVGAGNESSATGTVKNAYGINVDVQKGNGIVNNGYGVFIKRVQGTNTYGIYQQGDTTKNYFAGNVGIGTNTPDTKLAVNGNIHAKEVKVDLIGWPDYVFYDDYKLLSLSELEEYINENGHLPNVPNAKEVEQEGLELGEMSKIQQEKIEELTLYVIDQNKAIEKQRKEIEELKVLVKTLLEKK